MPAYFAYGANIDPARMSERVPGVTVVGPAHLPDFRLEFTIRDREWGGGVANIRPYSAERVWGMVYEGPDEAFAVLDTFRGDASHLLKDTVTVVMDDGERGAFTYRIDHVANHVKPSFRYLTHLTESMTAGGFPLEAIDSVLNADRYGYAGEGPSIVS